MAQTLNHMLCLVLLTLAAVPGGRAVDYVVSNNAGVRTGGGSSRFEKEVGVEYAKKTLGNSTEFIWKMLELNSKHERKNIEKVGLIVENIDGMAFASNNVIHVSAPYLNKYKGDMKSEFTGMIYHEMSHVWMWTGNGEAPDGLVEGMADFMRLKAGYAPDHWVNPGVGDAWDQGYDITARFLEYCCTLKSGFVTELHKKLVSGSYSEDFFIQILGKPVGEIWMQYKNTYHH